MSDAWNKITIISIVAIIVVAVGAPILGNMLEGTDTDLPDEVQRSENGIDLLTNYYETGPSAATGAELVRYLLLPFLLVWVLVYGVLEGGGGRYLPNKIIMPLSVLFAVTSVFSAHFVNIALMMNYFGALGLFGVGFFVLFLGVSAFVREARWDAKSKEERLFLQEDKLTRKAAKYDKKIYQQLENSLNDNGIAANSHGFENNVLEFVEKDLASDQLFDLSKEIRKMYKKYDRYRTNYDEKIIKYIGKVVRLAKKYRKMDERIKGGTKKRIKDEYESV